MTPATIRVSGIGKQYAIGPQQEQAAAAGGWLVAPWRRLRRLQGHVNGDDLIWALRDVSFEVHAGEVVGVIGRNGAGKSTLLKVLSRITEPTSGRVEIRGRISSLLEVGTGFHPQLTGRENVFLNGAILGMRRREIQAHFDEIVAFAEVERFIDTPVKHYSTGMKVRLGFAVAAHLRPQILLVDEVLSVGDAAFQRKCLGKVESAAAGGRTVLIVSHNMSSIARLTGRCLLLEGGRLVYDGPTPGAIERYFGGQHCALSRELSDVERPRWVGELSGLCLTGVSVNIAGQIPGQKAGCVEIRINSRARRSVREASLSVGIADPSGFRFATLSSEDAGLVFSAEADESLTVMLSLDAALLPPGRYLLQISATSGGSVLDSVQDALLFDMPAAPTDAFALAPRNHRMGVRLAGEWRVHGGPETGARTRAAEARCG